MEARSMPADRRGIAITGANGFIGRNLAVRLREAGFMPHCLTRSTPSEEARAALAGSEVVFHLAGVNRPRDPGEFIESNQVYARWVAEAIAGGEKRPLVIC